MRRPVDAASVRALARELDRAVSSPVVLYLTGGATAVLHGWRDSTVDVDVRFEPDDDDVLRAVPRLKESLEINIELVSPPDFLPELPGWRERSLTAFVEGKVTVRHFDPYSQALGKIERGFAQDDDDVAAMLRDGLVEPTRLRELHAAIEDALFRFPAVDGPRLRRRLDQALSR